MFNYNWNIDKNCCYFEDINWKKINPIFQEFWTFGSLYSSRNDNSDYLIEKLKQAKINEVELFDIDMFNAHSLKMALNPENYKFKIRKLSLTSIDHCLLKGLEIENIILIGWKILQLSVLKSTSIIYRILSALPSNMTVKLGQISSDNYNVFFI